MRKEKFNNCSCTTNLEVCVIVYSHTLVATKKYFKRKMNYGKI